MYPVKLASALTGVSVAQLHGWRRSELLAPEVSNTRPVAYSFRDLMALRTVARLRAEASLQKVRRAFQNMHLMELRDHPSTYTFATDGSSISVFTEDGFIDIVNNPGQFKLYTMDDILRPFKNLQGEIVVDFENPRPHLEVNEDRLGGWPTILNTRVPFDLIANLLADGSIRSETVHNYYPSVSPLAAEEALDFQEYIENRNAS